MKIKKLTILQLANLSILTLFSGWAVFKGSVKLPYSIVIDVAFVAFFWTTQIFTVKIKFISYVGILALFLLLTGRDLFLELGLGHFSEIIAVLITICIMFAILILVSLKNLKSMKKDGNKSVTKKIVNIIAVITSLICFVLVGQLDHALDVFVNRGILFIMQCANLFICDNL